MQAVAGPPLVRAPQAKNASSTPRPSFQVGAQGVLPTRAEHGADMPRLASSLLQSKRDGKALWKLPGRSLGVWKPFLPRGHKGHCHCKVTFPKALPSRA